MTSRMQGLLDRIRDDVREAVLEGDAQDCSSADCIADATYEIVRVALRDYLLVSEADLAAAMRDVDEQMAHDFPEERDSLLGAENEKGRSEYAAAIFAALGAAQEKGEAGSPREDHRRTCDCGHRYGVHATNGTQCLAVVDDPDRTSLIPCSCQRWTPR